MAGKPYNPGFDSMNNAIDNLVPLALKKWQIDQDKAIAAERLGIEDAKWQEQMDIAKEKLAVDNFRNKLDVALKTGNPALIKGMEQTGELGMFAGIDKWPRKQMQTDPYGGTMETEELLMPQSPEEKLMLLADQRERTQEKQHDNRLSEIRETARVKAEAPPKPPKDFRYKADGSGDIEPIPGGKADIEFQNKAAKARSSYEEVTSSMDDLAKKTQEVIDHPGLKRITGVWGATPFTMPGGDAANAQAKLDSLKSRVGLTVLAQLKAATGAGLGQVTEAEHVLLQNYLEALKTAQSEEAIKESLKGIVDWASGAKGRLSTYYYSTPYAKNFDQKNPSASKITAPRVGDIRPGKGGQQYRFKGGDQYKPENWEPVKKPGSNL